MADKDVAYVRHPGAEFRAFRSPTGMTGKWTLEQANKVADHARLLAPKPGQGKGYATGETVFSIKVDGPTVGRSGPEVRVLSNTDHARFVHEGTTPHKIRARPGKKLVFFSRKAGRVLFKDEVHHPGTRANPFLVKALRAVFGGPGR